ncbi:cation diffusion facilitator family transporter [Nesterenkonia sp. MY13]|uniref:Cation diffusion facilitator family transporter n=1 Tax=Nesterenkonia sedimenti TaxID=1463632 RepID=A0A7X8TLG0_9MICC|nr:cation diffusion facilitator family transporter [Nesterenkonia sedimenti]NLS10759.1 cation diffusion facilitator family transporter [Nesterenkonia sedimenti]
MNAFGHAELPAEQKDALAKARKIQWIWLGVLVLTVAAMATVMGNSQAMQTALVEDGLSFLPPLAFLIGARVARMAPSRRFPFGFHRAVGVGHLVSGVALAGIGLLLIFEGASTLLEQKHPPIGVVNFLGTPIWMGWLMMSVALASCITPVILGRIKRRLAEQLHDKVLRADADMNRADWMTGLATAAGVAGIGMGWWWADAAAALLISISITKDGWENTRDAIRDLVDMRATTFDNSQPHWLIGQINAEVLDDPLVHSVQARARDQGHVLHVELFVQLRQPGVEVSWVEQLRERCRNLDWRLEDVVITLTSQPFQEGESSLDHDQGEGMGPRAD